MTQAWNINTSLTYVSLKKVLCNGLVIPPEAEEFRNEVKAFIAEHLTEDVISSTHDGTIHNWEFHQKIAERGWLGALSHQN
ncbi:MAG: hypothetical protein CM15mP49_38270 [Actinomycetota bacterium]|nr:MAG: hypothetical protein CM15mP49_38270 [Actinomycetota bacterium]